MSLRLDKSKWSRVSMGDIATASKEKVDPTSGDVEWFIAGEHMDTDNLKIQRRGELAVEDVGPAFHRRFRPGQVLYGSRRTYLRKVAVADFDGVCANTTFVVTTKDENILLQEFLPFIMTAEPFHAFAIRESKGSVNPYVNWSDIERYEFDLPPIEEQQRLAGLLWALQQHGMELDHASDHVSAASEAWVENALCKHVTVSFESVATLAHGRPVPGDLYRKGDFPLLRPGDMHPDGSVSWSESSVTIPREFATQYPNSVLKPGDLVINMTAQSLDDRFLGRVCLMSDEALLNQRIGLLHVDADLSPEFAFVALRTKRFTDWVARRSEGSKVKHMHWSHIADFPIPTPPLDEQVQIVDAFRAWERSRLLISAELELVSSLRTAVSAEIFGGSDVH